MKKPNTQRISPMTSKIHRMWSAGATSPPPPRSRRSRTRTINATTSDLPPFEAARLGAGAASRVATASLGRPAPFHQRAPASGLDLDAVFPGRCADALPCRLALRVADALDLVEAGDRVAHVTGVVERLLPFPREGEAARGHAVFLA